MRRREPHRKVLGRVSCMLFQERRTRSSSFKNGLLIAYNFATRDFETVRLREMTQSDCFSAAMILSSSSGAGGSSSGDPLYSMTIGRVVGQQSRVFYTGVPWEQNSQSCRTC